MEGEWLPENWENAKQVNEESGYGYLRIEKM